MKHYRSCNLCEAICGLEIEYDGNKIFSVRGDKLDPLSRGHICPKAVALRDIYEDPARLKKPVKKTANGWQEISWQQAFDEIDDRLGPLRREFGNDAVAVYLGNPTVHNYGALTFNRAFIKALGTRNSFTATSVDQLPHHFAAHYMFGHTMLLPVPDIDHTDHILIMGANPVASNGSMMTAPGMDARLKAIRARGGRVILIDPRKTETARLADQHHFIWPGSDVWLLGAMLHVIFRDKLEKPGRLRDFTANWDALEAAFDGITPALAEHCTGIDADKIEEIARDFANSKRAVCYGRMGLSTQAHGGLCQWLINVLNIVTGNFDRPGGAMLTLPAVDIIRGRSTLGKAGRWKSKARGLPEFDGDLPVSALAEDILHDGDGKIRALITSAGNPVLSTPNGKQLEKAIESLDFMIAIDIYINETTCHADLILPPATGLETDHYDLIFNMLAVRNIAKYSPALFKPEPGSRYDWQILKELTRRFESHHDQTGSSKRRTMGQRLKQSLTPTRILALGLALGPWGVWRSPLKLLTGLSLRRLKKAVHGIDLGPLTPRFPDILLTPDQKLDIAPAILVGRLQQVISSFESECGALHPDVFLLIGRRHVRSNNSWMHNSERLMKGKNRCTLMMHRQDADRMGFVDGEEVSVRSRVGEVRLPVEIIQDIMPGVVSMPHGYGHNRKHTKIPVAEAHAGASINDITDETFIDELTGNAAFSGQPVKISPVTA